MAHYGKDVFTGPVESHSYDRWSFDKFLDEIIHLSEIDEVPGIRDARQKLIKVMWEKYPVDCRAIGLKGN
jgi:hypothetical protein